MKHVLSVCDIKDEVEELIDIAEKFKNGKIKEKVLKDKVLAMILKTINKD